MLIALVGQAYTGKTTIAQELERRGFTILSFTDHLKQMAAGAVNLFLPAGQYVTLTEVLADKPKYRRFIQEFGSLIGFETDPRFIEEFLAEALEPDGSVRPIFERAVVVDCLRSAAQIAGARKFGATIAGVYASRPDRSLFAGGAGLVETADSHPIDGSLDVYRMGCDFVGINSPETPITDYVSSLLAGIHMMEVASEAL